MTVEHLITTEIAEVKYELDLCDEGRRDEHYRVEVIRVDDEATAQYAGIIVTILKLEDYNTAKAVYDALVTVATLDHARRQRVPVEA